MPEMTAEKMNALIRKSLENLGDNQVVYNQAGDLRLAGVPIAESFSDARLVAHKASELLGKLEEAAASSVDFD